jgi:hypothetical protein
MFRYEREHWSEELREQELYLERLVRLYDESFFAVLIESFLVRVAVEGH